MGVTNVPLRAPTRVHQTRRRLLTMAASALAICVTVERPAQPTRCKLRGIAAIHDKGGIVDCVSYRF